MHLEAEPNPGTRRLMDWLGVTVEVRPVSDSPVDHVRRPQGTRGRTMGHYAAGYELPVVEAGKPDWIDYRASVGRAERRLEAGELVSRCWSCKTELDVPAPVHSPRCRTIGKPLDGREALDAMDGLVSQAELLDEHQADDEPAEVSLKPLPVSPPALEEPKPEEEVEMAKPQAARWTREQIIEAVQAWAREHGKPPSANEWRKGTADHPTNSTLRNVFGSWRAGIEAAGFEAPIQGGRRSSVREPKAREAAVSPPPADVGKPGAPGDDAVVRESPGTAVGTEEAGSRTDESPGINLIPAVGLEEHREWYANLPPEVDELRDEIARLALLSVVSAKQRDALQAFLDVLEAE